MHQLDFRAPAGWTLIDTSLPGARDGSLQVGQDGELITVRFEVDQRLSIPISLTFSGP